MMRLLIALLGLFGVSCVAAQAPQSPAVQAPAPPGPVALDANSTIDQILDALDARGQGLNDFTADVSLTEMDALSGDTTVYAGKVWYQGQGPGHGRIRVLFDSRKVGESVDRNYRKEYLLDKGWLIERDHPRKLQVSRQVMREGQKMNLLQLGQGPFPLPIGQPREEVLKMFEVKKPAAAKDAPANTVHIQLVPRPKTQFARDFRSIDVWVDQTSNFPRRIATLDPNASTFNTTDLGNLRLNVGLTDEQFTFAKVQGWTEKTEPMQ